MLEQLLEWDRNTLIRLNLSGEHTVFLDFAMWMSTQILIWLPAFIAFFYVAIKNKKYETTLIFISVVILFLLCDQVTSSILKPLIARPRPGHDPLIMDFLQYVNNYRGGQFGYPSSHAANSFAFAMFSSLLFKYRFYTFVAFLWASLCAYTRLYLGVHFPLDIISGIIIGLIFGGLCYFIYLRLKQSFPLYSTSGRPLNLNIYTLSGFLKSDVRIVIYILGVTLFCIICFAFQMRKFF